MCLSVRTCKHYVAQEKLENNLWELILSFRHVGSGNWTRVSRLSGKHLLPAEPSH